MFSTSTMPLTRQLPAAVLGDQDVALVEVVMAERSAPAQTEQVRALGHVPLDRRPQDCVPAKAGELVELRRELAGQVRAVRQLRIDDAGNDVTERLLADTMQVRERRTHLVIYGRDFASGHADARFRQRLSRQPRHDRAGAATLGPAGAQDPGDRPEAMVRQEPVDVGLLGLLPFLIGRVHLNDHGISPARETRLVDHTQLAARARHACSHLVVRHGAA